MTTEELSLVNWKVASKASFLKHNGTSILIPLGLGGGILHVKVEDYRLLQTAPEKRLRQYKSTVISFVAQFKGIR